jgi:hypothetical protein
MQVEEGAKMKIQILLILSSTFILCAGCGGDDSNESGQNRSVETMANETVELSSEQYYVYPFEITDKNTLLRLSITNYSYSSIELYTTDEEGLSVWESYAQGQVQFLQDLPFYYNDSLSTEALSKSFTSDWESIPQGKYAIIFDNTSLGILSPAGSVTIGYQIDVK